MRLARVKRTPEGATPLILQSRPQQMDLTASTDAEEHFLEVYQRLHERVLNYAECSLSTDDARDAAQEAIASLWYQWGSLSLEQRNEEYAFGILRRCVRAKRMENRHLVPLDYAEAEIERHVVREEFNESRRGEVDDVLDAALTAMPARRREVFLLVREESFTYRQAAAILGLSFGTIKTHMLLAKNDLRAAFTTAGFHIADARPKLLPAPKGDATND